MPILSLNKTGFQEGQSSRQKTWWNVLVKMKGQSGVITIIPPLFINDIFWHNNKRYRRYSTNWPVERYFQVPANSREDAIQFVNNILNQLATQGVWCDLKQKHIYKRFQLDIVSTSNTGATTLNGVNANSNRFVGDGYIENWRITNGYN